MSRFRKSRLWSRSCTEIRLQRHEARLIRFEAKFELVQVSSLDEEVWMARYFFYVSNDKTFKDEVGRRLFNPGDAKAHAVVAKELAEDVN
jgi:hypothetical protein